MAELIWDGEHDKDGCRTAPLRVALPFQTAKTLHGSAQERQLSMDRFLSGHDAGWNAGSHAEIRPGA